jgi:hypothetical protein
MSGADLVLDTNVVLGFLSGKGWARSFFEKAIGSGARLSVSSVTRMELLGFPGITPQEESALSDFLREVFVVPIDESVEDEAIRLRRGHRLKLPDAIIAATAMVADATLVTADRGILELPEVRTLDPTESVVPQAGPLSR